MFKLGLATVLICFAASVLASTSDDSNKLSKIEVTLPTGKAFMQLKVVGRYGDQSGGSYELFAPFAQMTDSHGKIVSFEFAATSGVRNALCSIASSDQISRTAKPDPRPMTTLEKSVPTRAIVYGDNGFSVVDGVKSVAGRIYCYQTRSPYKGLETLISRIEVVRKKDSALLRGELRAVGVGLNPFGLPLSLIRPQIYLDGRAIDLYAGSPNEATALCRAAKLNDRGVGGTSRGVEQNIPVIAFKEGKFFLYDSVSNVAVMTYVTCGGMSGGDGSR